MLSDIYRKLKRRENAYHSLGHHYAENKARQGKGEEINGQGELHPNIPHGHTLKRQSTMVN